MNLFLKTCLIVGACLFAVPGTGLADDLKKMEGIWQPEKAAMGGQDFPEDQLSAMALEIVGDRYTVKVGEIVDRGKFKMYEEKRPRGMDIIGSEGPNKGKTYPCIYKLEKDSLTVCYDLSGMKRPTKFESPAGTQLFLVVYKRAK